MKLRDDIIARFPGEYVTYAEPFCGAAWVLFRKRRSKFEDINDMNNNLANLYWLVQENAEALRDRLLYAIDCEKIFYTIRDTLKSKAELGDLTRAAWFYQLLRFSYGSKASSYNGRGHDIWRDFPAIMGATLLEARDLGGRASFLAELPNGWMASAIVAFVSGLLSLVVLRKLVTSDRWWLFAIYCILLGSASVVCSIVGV